MSNHRPDQYEAPEVIKHGSVESITQVGNKKQLGEDTDEQVINLRGSVGYK